MNPVLFALVDAALADRASNAERDTLHLKSDRFATMATYNLGAWRALWPL